MVRCRFELAPPLRRRVTKAIHEHIDADAEIAFETTENLNCGIELRADSYVLGWSLDGYLDAIERHLQCPPRSIPGGIRRQRSRRMTGNRLTRVVGDAFAAVGLALTETQAEISIEDIGSVMSVSQGVATVSGLAGVGAEELLRFPNDVMGFAFSLEPDWIGVVLLDEPDGLGAGADVKRTRRIVDVPVGEALLGRVVDALGRPLDEGGPIDTRDRWPIERDAPAILERGGGDGTATDRDQGDRCADPDRPRAARVDPGRSPDRQDGDRGRYHPQPARPGCDLRLLRDRPARRRRRPGHCRSAPVWRDGDEHRRRRRRRGPARHAVHCTLHRDHDRRILHGTRTGCADCLRRSDPACAGLP